MIQHTRIQLGGCCIYPSIHLSCPVLFFFHPASLISPFQFQKVEKKEEEEAEEDQLHAYLLQVQEQENTIQTLQKQLQEAQGGRNHLASSAEEQKHLEHRLLRAEVELSSASERHQKEYRPPSTTIPTSCWDASPAVLTSWFVLQGPEADRPAEVQGGAAEGVGVAPEDVSASGGTR